MSSQDSDTEDVSFTFEMCPRGDDDRGDDEDVFEEFTVMLCPSPAFYEDEDEEADDESSSGSSEEEDVISVIERHTEAVVSLQSI